MQTVLTMQNGVILLYKLYFILKFIIRIPIASPPRMFGTAVRVFPLRTVDSERLLIESHAHEDPDGSQNIGTAFRWPQVLQFHFLQMLLEPV